MVVVSYVYYTIYYTTWWCSYIDLQRLMKK